MSLTHPGYVDNDAPGQTLTLREWHTNGVVVQRLMDDVPRCPDCGQRMPGQRRQKVQ